jgi:hypothetical protein
VRGARVRATAITDTAILISGAMPACGSARAMASANAYVRHKNTTT